jgi:hypothetical protein
MSRSIHRFSNTSTIERLSARIGAAYAFVFVMPEYRCEPPPSPINAVDYVYREWKHKPAGFVQHFPRASRGSGREADPHDIEGRAQFIADEQSRGSELQVQAAKVMLDELLGWVGPVKPLRG